MLVKLFLSIGSARKRQLVGIFLLMLVGALAEMMTLGAVVPFIAVMTDVNAIQNYEIFRFLDPYISGYENQSIRMYVAVGFAITAVFTGFIRVLLTWSTHSFVYGVGNDIATRTYENILRKPYDFHIKTNSSKIVGSFNNIQLLIENVIFYVMRASVSIVIATFLLTAMIFIAPKVVLLTMAGFVVVFAITRLLTGKYLKQNSLLIANTQAKRIQAILEGTGAIRDIIIGRTNSIFSQRFHELDKEYQNAYARNESISRTPRIIVEAVGMAAIAIIALYLTGQSGGAISALPILGALALGAQRLLPLLQDAFEAWAHYTGYQDIINDVLQHLDPVEELKTQSVAGSVHKEFRKDITLENLTFKYAKDDNPVLKNASLKISKGSVVGIVGETGSGKSSLTDLVLGLLEPTEGSIKIDGQALKHSDLVGWHDQVAHVPQTVFLQDTSIAENIAFGISPDAIDHDRLHQVTKLARLDNFVSGLPDGYQTQVGDRGARLSGGQIQRIGIARALYKGADVLVFDEATSALDMKTEASVMNSLRDIAEGRTIIIVAHRISTLSYCDKIIEIVDGRIVEKRKEYLGKFNEMNPRREMAS